MALETPDGHCDRGWQPQQQHVEAQHQHRIECGFVAWQCIESNGVQERCEAARRLFMYGLLLPTADLF